MIGTSSSGQRACGAGRLVNTFTNGGETAAVGRLASESVHPGGAGGQQPACTVHRVEERCVLAVCSLYRWLPGTMLWSFLAIGAIG